MENRSVKDRKRAVPVCPTSAQQFIGDVSTMDTVIATFSRFVYLEDRNDFRKNTMTRSRTAVCAVGLCLLFGCKVTNEPNVQERGLDVSPSWSWDGSLIAFTGVYNGVQGIYSIDTNGTNLRLIAAGAVGGSSWSPDSKWLAYVGSDGIYKVKANGDSMARLTNSSFDYHPSWSPDGARIAFVRANYGVLIYDLRKGTESAALGSGFSPSWHPDGHLIAMTSVYLGVNQGLSYTFYEVWPDSVDARPIYSFGSFSDCTYCSASPAGAAVGMIAYSARASDDYTQVWTLTLSTGLRVQLTTDSGDGPSWSPDGGRIIFTRTIPGDGGLWLMNSDGSGKRRLTNPSQS